MDRMVKRIFLGTSIILWIALVCCGFIVLFAYSSAPGTPGDPPRIWPAGSRLPRIEGRQTLLLFAHPRCPCSRASIYEFEKILSRTKAELNAVIVFIKPSGVEADWEKWDPWQRTQSIPGVQVFTDDGGAEALRFKAFTSGQALLYDPESRLRFQGGITASRGHEGDNEGKNAILSLLNGSIPTHSPTAVFGCPLRREQEESHEKS